MKTVLYRFSADGFNAHYQQFHVEAMKLGLKHFQEKKQTYPIHLVPHIEESYKGLLTEWGKFTNGIFTFVGVLPDPETIRILLNHLAPQQRKNYFWWTAEIDVKQYCFDVNNSKLWKKQGFASIKDMVDKMNYEIFIPSQFLKVDNIQQWTNDYRSINHQYSMNEHHISALHFKTNKKKDVI